MTQYSVRNCGPQGRRWLIPGPVQISCFGLDVCESVFRGLAPLASPNHEQAKDHSPLDAKARRREDARLQGYTGGSCGEWNFTQRAMEPV